MPSRRDLLKTATALPLLTMAGCLGVLDSGELPAYAESTPRDGADDEDGVFFVHIDTEWLRGFDGEVELPYSDQLPDAVDIDVDPSTPAVDFDPLVAYPTTGLALGAFGIGTGLLPYGFGDVVLDGLDEDVVPNETDESSTQQEETTVDGTVRIDSMLLVDGVGVFRGEFDARAVVAAAGGFEPTGEQNGFDVYEGSDDGFFTTEDLAFAVRDGVLVTLLDQDADLEVVLETIAGDIERLSDTDDGGWALTEAGHGHVTLGVWGAEPQQATETEYDSESVDTGDVFENADGFVSSLTLGPDEGVGTISAVFPPDEVPQQAAVENQVGTSASTREINIDGTKVSISGIWRVPTEEPDE